MRGRMITEEMITDFQKYLREEEKSVSTTQKYIRDVITFKSYANENEVTKEIVIAFKQQLVNVGYAVRSVNSMLASLNSLFSFLGWHDLKVKTIKVQRQVFCSEEKELTKAEYERLCRTAQKKKNERLYLILQTI